MTTDLTDNEPCKDKMMPENPYAFPSKDITPCHPGMTLRDWIAGQALAGMIASESPQNGYYSNADHAAERSYFFADAMLAERAK